MMDENGKEEIFICQHCGKEFEEKDGTWLPVGEEHPRFMTLAFEQGPLKVFNWDMRQPEIITDDKFTCYNCL